MGTTPSAPTKPVRTHKPHLLPSKPFRFQILGAGSSSKSVLFAHATALFSGVPPDCHNEEIFYDDLLLLTWEMLAELYHLYTISRYVYRPDEQDIVHEFEKQLQLPSCANFLQKQLKNLIPYEAFEAFEVVLEMEDDFFTAFGEEQRRIAEEMKTPKQRAKEQKLKAKQRPTSPETPATFQDDRPLREKFEYLTLEFFKDTTRDAMLTDPFLLNTIITMTQHPFLTTLFHTCLDSSHVNIQYHFPSWFGRSYITRMKEDAAQVSQFLSQCPRTIVWDTLDRDQQTFNTVSLRQAGRSLPKTMELLQKPCGEKELFFYKTENKNNNNTNMTTRDPTTTSNSATTAIAPPSSSSAAAAAATTTTATENTTSTTSTTTSFFFGLKKSTKSTPTPHNTATTTTTTTATSSSTPNNTTTRTPEPIEALTVFDINSSVRFSLSNVFTQKDMIGRNTRNNYQISRPLAHHKFPHRVFQLTDEAGQVGKRKKWSHHRDGTNVMLYTIPLGDFGRPLWEIANKEQDRLRDALQVIRECLSSRKYGVRESFVIFTKCDVYRERVLRGESITISYPDFVGNELSLQDVCAYLFQELLEDRERNWTALQTAFSNDNVHMLMLNDPFDSGEVVMLFGDILKTLELRGI